MPPDIVTHTKEGESADGKFPEVWGHRGSFFFSAGYREHNTQVLLRPQCVLPNVLEGSWKDSDRNSAAPPKEALGAEGRTLSSVTRNQPVGSIQLSPQRALEKPHTARATVFDDRSQTSQGRTIQWTRKVLKWDFHLSVFQSGIFFPSSFS